MKLGMVKVAEKVPVLVEVTVVEVAVSNFIAIGAFDRK